MASRQAPDVKSTPTERLEAGVFGATIQLPMFDRSEPDAWFALADANFGLRKITESQTKYWYVLSKFDSTMLKKLATFLKLPRGEDPYQKLRDKLCQTFEPPLEQKLDALLSLTEIGDERPVEFGLEIQRLLANATTDDIAKRIFLRCLPQSVVTAINSSVSGNFESVMLAADRAWTTSASATSTASVSAISGTSQARGGKRGGRQRGGRSGGQVRSAT